MNWIRSIAVLIATGAIAAAAPTITAVQDAAGYDTEITRGAMAIVKGSGLGPNPLIKANSFPLMTTFNGVSIKIEVNGTTTDGIMFYVWDSQSAFVLPSTTPSGSGTLTYTYNGESATSPITVIDRNPQIYTLDSSGSGQAVVTFHANNFFGDGYVQNNNAINPGNIVIVWMQGLGPVNFDETVGAQQIDLSSGVQLTVGGAVPSTIYYLGRYAGDGTSVDLAVFEWPSGIQQTCSVPIQVTANGRSSNAVTAPAADSGRTCSSGNNNGGGDTTSPLDTLFSQSEINNFLNASSITGGTVNYTVSKNVQLINVGGGQVFESATGSEGADAGFFELFVNQNVDEAAIRAGLESLTGGRFYTCETSTHDRFDIPDDIDPNNFGFRALDAGNLTAADGFGTLPFEKQSFGGLVAYNLDFSNGQLANAGPITTTATGSADVDPFTATVNTPSGFAITNLEALRRITRSSGIPVNWTPVSSGIVTIKATTIMFTDAINGTVKDVTCVAPASDGSFTVPADMASYLDATEGFNSGDISITYSYIVRAPSNLDFVIVTAVDDTQQSADYD